MDMRNRSAFAVLFLLLLALLSVSAVTAQDEPVTLVLLSGETDHETFQRSLDRVAAAYPNITIEWQEVPYTEYLEILLSKIQAGDQIDILQVNGDVFLDLVAQGVLLDVTDKIDYYDRFYEDTFYQFFEVDGRRYGVPHGSAYSYAWWYNEALFEKLGLEVPTTYDELVEVSQVLDDNGIVPFAHAGAFYGDWYHMSGSFFLDQMTGNNVVQYERELMAGERKFTDPEWAAAFECGLQYFNDGLMGDPSQYSGLDNVGAETLFRNGQAAFYINGTWNFGPFREAEAENPENFRPGWMLPVLCPNAPEGATSRALNFPAILWAIYSGSEHPDESVAVLDILSNDEAAQDWAENGQTNLTLNRGVTPVVDDPLMDEMGEDFVNGFTSSDWGIGIQMTEKVAEEFQRTVAGEQTVEEGLANIQTFWDEVWGPTVNS
jgi:raffinose/stachyose/melibiose transport system substrate-binding protein